MGNNGNYELDSATVSYLVQEQVQLIGKLQKEASRPQDAAAIAKLTEALNYALYGLNELLPIQMELNKDG